MTDHKQAAIEAGAEDKSRFWEKVQKTDGCWLWTAEISTGGYGRFSLSGSKYQAHRLAYEWKHNTKVPDELHMDHLCRVRECVNPNHLEPVTISENLRRGELGFGLDGKCRSGRHDVTSPGSVIVTSAGHNRCEKCYREASKASNDKRGQRRKKARQEAFLESPEGAELISSIRAMIAQEIRETLKNFEPSCQEDVIWHDAHMNAAQIAKGPQ